MRRYAFYAFPFGYFKIGYETDCVIILKAVNEVDEENHPTAFTDEVFGQLEEYLQGKRKSLDFPFRLQGTEFQMKVWNALSTIPYGETRSYKEIAEMIGNPKASRAVGMANNRNPIFIMVPCHRVIGANGALVGYGGGLPLKQFLLDMEKSTCNSSINIV